ncbi:MAG: hypothetical protein JWN56_437 [Sphingobacteriales bacterium]|nr:hypothetical protein [Sphingobacteriales bacterium]
MHPARKIYISFSILLALICFVELKAQNKLPFLKASQVTSLDNGVHETSGLIYFDNSFWTINDSGGANILYRIDPTDGKITQQITISNAENKDWEEITADEKFVYIADIGDNNHERKEKQIYKIAKADILKNSKDRVMLSEIIRFKYPESDKSYNYNAEAMVSDGTVLHLFTKDLLESNHFTIPLKAGKYTASYVEKLETKGQVTGAALDRKSKSLILVGYFGFGDRLLWKFTNFTNTNYFKGKVQKFSLGNITETSQVEAVCFDKNNKTYFSNESFGKVKQTLWSLVRDILK